MEALLKHFPMGKTIHWQFLYQNLLTMVLYPIILLCSPCIIVYNACINNTAIAMPAGPHELIKNKLQYVGSENYPKELNYCL